jgi:hypothetical protein
MLAACETGAQSLVVRGFGGGAASARARARARGPVVAGWDWRAECGTEWVGGLR